MSSAAPRDRFGLTWHPLLAGAILTESIFSWPGIGKWMVDSVFRRDYPVIQGGLLIILSIVLFGAKWSEPTLISIAYGFEQHAKAWQPPRFLDTVGGKPLVASP